MKVLFDRDMKSKYPAFCIKAEKLIEEYKQIKKASKKDESKQTPKAKIK